MFGRRFESAHLHQRKKLSLSAGLFSLWRPVSTPVASRQPLLGAYLLPLRSSRASPPLQLSDESLADADDAALMRLLRLNLSSFAETSVSTPVNHTGSLSNKRESAVYPCALHYTGHTRAFLPETLCRKARYHAANALQANQPCFPSAALSRIENRTF